MRETSNLFSKQNSQQPKQFRGDDKKVMKKSLLAFVLAFSLVLSVAVPAFAATPADVVGKKEQSAVEELMALGVLNGYADGTFKPGNDITRAELAKVIVVASGNEGAATLMAGVKPSFTDVKAGAWYTGYINAASAKGFVQGYNGKFRPSDNVKFEEVVAMLVRALGYKEAKLTGAWPYNYLLAGQDAGLFSGVDITPGTLANRGVVAKLTSNTINSATVTYNATTGELSPGAKLIAKIGDSSTGILTDSVLDSNKKVSIGSSLLATADGFVVTGGKKLAELAGREVTVITVNGKVAAISDKQDASKVVTGTVKTAVANLFAGSVSVALKDVTTTYPVVASPLFFKNGVKVTADAVGDDLTVGSNVNLYLDGNGNVRAVAATEYTITNKLFESFAAKTSYSEAKVLYNGGNVVVNDNTVIKLNGETAKVTDLKVDDVLAVVVGGGKAVTLEATRTSVQGKVTATATTNGVTSYTINGTNYEAISAVDGLVGGPVAVTTTEKIYVLNKDNKIVKVKGVAGATSTTKYGVVLEVVDNVAILDGVQVTTKDKVTFYNLTAKEKQVLYVNADTFGKLANGDPGTGPAVATFKDLVASFTFNAEGKATEVATTGTVAVSDAAGTSVAEVSATSIKTTTLYNVNSNTVVVNASDVANPVVATIADVTVGKKVVIVSSGVNAELVAIVGNGVANASANITGLFVSATETVTASGSTYSVKVNVAGEEKAYTVTKAAFDDVAANAIVAKDLVTLKADFTALTKAAAAAEVNTVDTNNNTFKLGAQGYVLTSKSKVFVIDKDGNVNVAGLDVIKEAEDADVTTQYDVYVTDTTVTVGTAYKEVATIVIKKKV